MDAQGLQQAAQAFLAALNAQNAAQTQSLDQNRLNMGAQINNAANARGLLYSTQPAYQYAQYTAQKYMPAYSKLAQQQQQQTQSVNTTLADITKKIQALNAAAAQLGG
jgi:hypothetical protein